MGSESYYEMFGENTRTGAVEKRIIRCRSDDANENRGRAMREFARLRDAGFNLIRTQHVEVKTTDVEWLSHGE